MERERAAYVALALTPGIGPARLRTLLDACETAHGALTAPFKFLCAIPGVSHALATAIRQRSAADGEAVLEAAAGVGGTVLLPEDAEFPTLLRQIPEPPLLLFAQGRLSQLDRPAAAIVGSRDHSPYGAEACRWIARATSRAGVAIVSGMARGLDAVAHLAALDAPGGTIGVLGNGLGVVYPAANRGLYQRVAAEGLLLTEFPPGERPHAGSFPRRNRLISGLARVTVVVEAAVGSGALITASTALDQGREVMAVPGPITSPMSVGANRLIQDGAAPVLEPLDLLGHFPELAPFPAAEAESSVQGSPVSKPVPTPAELPDTLSVPERELAGRIGSEPIHIDVLASRVRRPIAELLAQLCSLELAGVVEQHPGNLFRRV